MSGVTLVLKTNIRCKLRC